MCFCESDVVNIKIHLKTRQRYPGVKFHEATLTKVAQEFGVRNSSEFERLSEEEVARVAAAVLRYLPSEACPPVPASGTAVA